MLTKEDNDLICRIGPGTPMGNVFRRYWHPVCLAEQLPHNDCDPLALKLLGQNFVAFRNTEGQLGLLDEGCMHRGTSLALGRVEHCGIRCIYHGWKYAVDGSLMDVPNHPDPGYMQRQRARAYPVREAGGIVWAYIGPTDKQLPFPNFPFLELPDEQRFVIRVNLHTNYLQNLEGGLDSSHSSNLHSDFFRPGWNTSTVNNAMDDSAPRLEVEDTEFGYHYAAFRRVTTEDGKDIENVRIMPFILPSSRIIPGRRRRSIGGGTQGVIDFFILETPMDDENTAAYMVLYGDKKIDREGALFQLGLSDERFWSTDDYTYKATAGNRWGQNRSVMDTSWTGFSGGIYIEDAAVIGSMGAIADRSGEHLVPGDKAIIRARRLLLEAAKAVAEGKEPRGLSTDFKGLSAFDGDLPANQDWHQLVPGHRHLVEHS